MRIKDILYTACLIMDDAPLADAILSNKAVDEITRQKINLLYDCASQIDTVIATDYVPACNTTKVSTTSGKISIGSLSGNDINDVISITTITGADVNYTTKGNTIYIAPGTYEVTYSFFPAKLTPAISTITYYPRKVSARAFAYGVASEYLFVKGNIDDAEVWNERFRQAMIACTRPTGKRVIKAPRWY